MTECDFSFREPTPEMVPEWSPALEEAKGKLLKTVREADSPVTTNELGVQLDLHWDEVWAVIEQLWREQEPLCTDGCGFWYSDSQSDLAITQEYLKEESRQLAEELAGMERAMSGLPHA